MEVSVFIHLNILGTGLAHSSCSSWVCYVQNSRIGSRDCTLPETELTPTLLSQQLRLKRTKIESKGPGVKVFIIAIL